MGSEKMPCPTEDREQQTVVEWARWQEGVRPELKNLFAIPNGGHRHKAVAGKLKAQGVKAGVPDLFLAHPVRKATVNGVSGPCAGLFIEMKRERGGKVSSEQHDWVVRLLLAGYACVVAKGADEAIKVIRDYLGMD